MTQKIRIGKPKNEITEGGSVNLQEKTVNSGAILQTVVPDIGYQGLSKVTVNPVNAHPFESNAPYFHLDNHGYGNLMTVWTLPKGYVSENMIISSPVFYNNFYEGDDIITPGTDDILLEDGLMLAGDITIKGEPNLLPENIAEGVSIFGVEGTHSGGGDDRSEILRKGLLTRNFDPPIDFLPEDFEGITEIGIEAFYSVRGLNSVEFPEGIVSFGENVFGGVTDIKKIVIPSTLNKIASSTPTIGSTPSLEEITWRSNLDFSLFQFPSTLTKIDISSVDRELGSYVISGATSKIKLYFNAKYYSYYTTEAPWKNMTPYPVGVHIPMLDTQVIILSQSREKTITIPIIGEFTEDNIPQISFDNDEGLSYIIDWRPSTTGQNIGFFDVTIVSDSDTERTITASVSCYNGISEANTIFEIKILQDITPSTYTVSNIDGVTYGFDLNSDGYYESKNKGIQGSFAKCRVDISSNGLSKMYIDCISYGENNYDYGVISLLDSTLTNTVDDTSFKASLKGLSSSNVQSIDFGIIPEGNHFVEIKYRKDGSGDNGNDTLQFKIRFENE